jgi:hypothetical protein
MCDRPPCVFEWAFGPRNPMKNRISVRRGPLWRTHSCVQFPETLNAGVDSEALGGAANPGCSRLLGGLLRVRMRWHSSPRDAPEGIVFRSYERLLLRSLCEMAASRPAATASAVFRPCRCAPRSANSHGKLALVGQPILPCQSWLQPPFGAARRARGALY